MAELSRSVATLRIVGDALVPAEVTAMLGCEPTASHALGDVVRSGKLPERLANFGSWTLAADPTEPADLDLQVESILSRLTGDLSIWQQLSSDFDVQLFCGWFMTHGNEGVSVSPRTLIALGQRNVLFDIDLYAP